MGCVTENKSGINNCKIRSYGNKIKCEYNSSSKYKNKYPCYIGFTDSSRRRKLVNVTQTGYEVLHPTKLGSIIHHFKAKEIITVTVIWINDFTNYYSVYRLVVSIENPTKNEMLAWQTRDFLTGNKKSFICKKIINLLVK